MSELKLLDQSKYIARGKYKEGLDPVIKEHVEKYGVKPEFIFIYSKSLKKLFPDFGWENDIIGVLEYEGVKIVKAKSIAGVTKWGKIMPTKRTKS